MAGYYMDAPNYRIPWDRDGSVLSLVTTSNNVLVRPTSEAISLNSEDGGTVTYSGIQYVAVIFPYPVDLTALFLSVSTYEANPSYSVQTSKDTTNGLDGTWVTQRTGVTETGVTRVNYRRREKLVDLSTGSLSLGVRGVRLLKEGSGYATRADLKALHFYGSLSVTATKDRLEFWDPVSNQKVSPYYFDWGDVSRSSTADRQFRIKNISEDLTAQDIFIYVESLTPGIPSIAGMHTLSSNGGSTFSNRIDITSLSPNEISPVYVLRRTVPNNAQLSLWSARMAADVGEWV